MEITARNRTMTSPRMLRAGAAALTAVVAGILVAGVVANASGQGTTASPWIGALDENSYIGAYSISSGPSLTPAPRLVMDDPVSALVVEVDSGVIELVGTAVGQVVVQRSVRTQSDRPLMTDALEDNQLTLRSNCGEEEQCWVDHRITVPRDVAVEVRGGSGDVTIVGVVGPFAITRSIGNVTIQDIAGEEPVGVAASNTAIGPGSSAEVRLLTGTIDLNFQRPVNRINASTKMGDVDISLPDGAYRIDAHTVIGQVRVEVPTDTSADSTINVEAPTGVIRVMAL
jgi:hypothetical protein